MNIRRAALVAATAVAMVGLAGACSLTPKPAATPSAPPSATGSPSPAAAAGFPDACNLFTDADMSALTKGQIAGHKAGTHSTPAAPDCDWFSKDGGITVSISLATTKKSDFDADVPNYTAVPGVGDGAYENHGILAVLHGTTGISVIFGGSGDESVAVQKAIASKIIEKLDGPASSASPSPSASA
jgi:hypothetical protein